MASISFRLPGLQASDAFCLVGVLLCTLCGFAQVSYYFHGKVLLWFALAIAASVVVAMLWLRWMHLNALREPRIRWLVLLWAFFALLFAVLFPISQRHILGPGSDRANALRVADSMLLHGRYLYSAKTYLGNPITPLPGAVLLALPFYLLGNVAIQNLLWLALFIAFCCWLFRDRSTALVFVLLLLGASPVTLDDFVVGGDFFVNAMYVCVAVALVFVTYEDGMPQWMRAAAAVFLGVAVDSRPIYIVVFPLVLAYLWQRRSPRAALRAVLISVSVAALLSLPFYLYSPEHFTPLHLKDKLSFIPARYHAAIVLPVFALLVSCIGFLIRLTRPRIFLLFGLSLFVMLGIPAVLERLAMPFDISYWYGVPLFTLPALFFSLWILSKYRQAGYRLRSATHSSSQHVCTSS